MKLSFSTLGCPGWGLDEVVAACRDYGYEGVELRGLRDSRELVGLPEFAPENLQATANRFRVHRIAVACVSTGLKFTDTTAAAQRERLATAGKYFEICNALDCEYIRVFGGDVAAAAMDRHVREINEQLQELCNAAKRKGVTPLVETHDSFCRSTDILKIVQGNSNIGIIWDILHPYRWGETMETTYAGIKDYIRHIHIKDSLNYSKDGFDITLPGEGTVPIKRALVILAAHGYDGFLSFEWERAWHPEIAAPEIALPHYTNYMKAIL